MDQDAAEIWNQILLHVQEKDIGIYTRLQKAGYTIENKKLTIYEEKKMFCKILQNKILIIAEILPDDYTIEIKAGSIQKDPELAALAEIFGGGEEVQIDA
jgi:hypothetical protein